MWRVLVMSDSHGNSENVKRAIEKTREEAGDFQLLIHLGDVGDAKEVEGLAGVPCYIVRGNTDYDTKLREVNVILVGEHRLFLTHGHRYGVHGSLLALRNAALENDCDIAMYGHTHVPFLDEDPDDVTILNPGSLTYPRQEGKKQTFVVMEVDDEEEVTYEFYNL